MLELVGWIGSLLFAFSALPQTIMVHQAQNADGLSWGLLLLWFGGELLTFTYVLLSGLKERKLSYPLLMNYSLNFIMLCYIIKVKLFQA